MDKLLDEYFEKFGEQFPLMACKSMTDDEINQTIQHCLDSGEPYNPELDPEYNY